MSFDHQMIMFWAIAALAAWVQTLTGFALGLILMGATGALGLMPVPQAAAITSLLVLVNAIIVLSRGWRDIDRSALKLILLGAFPALIAGFFLLNWLAGTALGLLQLILGIVIAGSAAQLASKPSPRPTQSAPVTFFLSGLIGGTMGGLFATTGPPVIWHLYRQPMQLAAVRVTLVAVFFLTQILRTGLVIASGGITASLLASAAGAAPAVILGTWIARRFPPPVEPGTIRKAALVLLFLSGISLIISALGKLG
ncbi:sulfite exporter TauE/SafE family protein [Paracoccus aerodenitrificans]|uniref:sulfite exporter TauE/SafE family protein n=1 Tax=Paracoccus aerodenitrificans TaxID=3017781 RepID=UPI0022F0009B|nr:sulfite exporter TauE/SafE family protein [Paracoccus aerodenitrificans]WBU63321.1 sulfite exporter TauE/SafE family protein [Paracoccus aerodenitrificans]